MLHLCITLYSRSYSCKSKFFWLNGSLLIFYSYRAKLGVFCALQALLSYTPIHAEHTKYVFYINVSIVINILGIVDEKENNILCV